MIAQCYKQEGLLPHKPNTSIFPMKSDIVLVFYPSPGIFVRDTHTLPEKYQAITATFFNEKGHEYIDEYQYLPAVLASQYTSGKNHHGIIYEEKKLSFDPELINFLSSLSLKIIEHRYG